MIDLRSDLLSRPTGRIAEAMVEAMASPAAFGLREDARQQQMEALAARLLGHEDALLFPTCTMANQTALLLLATPGSSILTQSDPHIATSEAGAPAALGGATLQALPGGATPDLAEWRRAARRQGDELRMPVAAVALENTHNRGGGEPLDPGYIDAVLEIARAEGLRAHLDGARLPNAALATGATLARLAGGFDTVSMNLNKGLCAPLGAVLAGPRTLIARALVIRQRLGGGLRPTALLAAAGMAALEDMSLIAEDHRRAARLAAGLSGLKAARVPAPRTNIVLLTLETGPADAAASLCQALETRAVRALPFGPATVRFVLYHGIGDAEVDQAVALIRAAAAQVVAAGPGA